MRKPRVYLSSSYDDLIEHRKAALEIIARQQLDGHGMEHYSVHSDLVSKSQSDARDADLLVLIASFRYGTRLADFDGKSLTELEYEAAADAGREILAFCQDEDAPVANPRLDDRIVESDRGERVLRFRKRLSDDHRLIGYFRDLTSFKDVLNEGLADYRDRYLKHRESSVSRREAQISSRTRTPNPAEESLLLYIEPLLGQKRQAFEKTYVSLAATTNVQERRDEQWDDDFEPPLTYGIDGNSKLEHTVSLCDVAQALTIHRRFCLVGPPGSGKTVTLKAIWLGAAERFHEDQLAPFPLLVDVSTWQPDREDFDALLAETIERETRVRAFPPDRLLLLVDGVVDSAADRPDRPLQKVEAWLAKHPRCSAILAVRSRSALSSQLPTVCISEMDDERVETFVRKRLGDENAKALLDQLHAGARGTIELARKPFNLWMCCKYHLLYGALPSTQGELIQRFVHAAYERESKRAVIPIELKSFLNALGAFGVGMIRTRAKLAADSAWLRKRLPSKDIGITELLALATDSMVMQERATKGIYEFTHRLYLEYFAAEFIRNDRDQLDQLLKPPRYEHGQRVADRFDEVVHLLVDFDASAEVIEKIAARDPFLAVTCLTALTADADQQVRAEVAVVKGLIDVLKGSSAEGREAATAALAEVGAPAIRLLLGQFATAPHWVRRSIVRALARIDSLDAVEGVVRALGDSNSWIREEATLAIRRFGRRSRDLLLEFIRTRIGVWNTGPERQMLERLAVITGRDPEMRSAIATATGLAIEDARPIELDAEDEADEREVSADSDDAGGDMTDDCGEAWLRAWSTDPGNPALNQRGRVLLQTTSGTHNAWGRVWTTLWHASPHDSDLAWWGRDWLANASPEQQSWPFIWRALFHAHAGEQSLEQHGRDWLRSAPIDNAGWATVWEELWRSARDRTELWKIAHSWLLTVSPAAQRWSLVWVPLWDESHDDVLGSIGRSWLGEPTTHASSSWGIVWRRLWDVATGDRGLIDVARTWLAAVPFSHKSWSWVWAALWRFERNAELEALGRQWLRTISPDHGSWIIVFDTLAHGAGESATDPEGDTALFAHICEWLDVAPKVHQAWGPAWSLAMRIQPGDYKLHAMGREYLDTVPNDHPSWGFVWRGLWVEGHDRDSLAVRGRWWLKEHGIGHTGFGFVWKELQAAEPDDLKLHLIALQWLRQSPMGMHSWTLVWPSLMKASPHNAELVEMGHSFIVAMPTDPRWQYVWQILWQYGGDQKSLAPLGRKWLMEHRPISTGFGYLWMHLYVHNPKDVEVRNTGLAWLEGSMSNSAWDHVWRKTLKVCSDHHILEAGRRYLERMPSNQPAWRSVWKSLWDYRSDRQMLEHLGRTWLVSSEPDAAGFAFICHRLLACRPDDIELARIAREYLKKTPWSDSGWPNVLSELLRQSHGDPELLLLGRTFVETAPKDDLSWAAVWDTLWTGGDDPAVLAPLGRDWVLGHGRDKSDNIWHVFERLGSIGMLDADIVQIAAGRLAIASPENTEWPNLWRVTADSGSCDYAFLENGRRWVESHRSAIPGWARVWGFLALRPDCDHEFLARGWEWMDPKYFHRRSWPQVWKILWIRAPNEHLRLATLAADWVIDQRGRRAVEITHWNEVIVTLDNDRSRAVRAILRIPS